MTERKGVKGSEENGTSWVADLLRATAGVPVTSNIDPVAEKDAWLNENGFRASRSLSPTGNAEMANTTDLEGADTPSIPAPNLVLVPRDAAYNPGILVAMYEEFKRTKSLERALHAAVAAMLDYHQTHPIMPDSAATVSVDDQGSDEGQRDLNDFYAAMTADQAAMHLAALRRTAVGSQAYDDAFNLGMVIAATHVSKAHGKDSIAAEILHSAGLRSSADVDALGADQFDINVAAAVLGK